MHVRESLLAGCTIPAHPLALDDRRRLSERHQRGLTRYYCAAGAGGIAVGVHSTQFEIHQPRIGLYEPVLALAAETIDGACARGHGPVLKVAGVSGRTKAALAEAKLAEKLGYHACLLALRDLRDDPLDKVLDHCRAVAEIMPLIGFYLQTAVGGRYLPLEFWREFAAIDNLVAIKIAPFNRYQTLDVVRAVCEVGRQREVALYTGNDDTIVFDLLSQYRIDTPEGPRQVCMAGGLLGHWGVWTRRAVEQAAAIQSWRASGTDIPRELLVLAHEVTDANAAFFDARNGFAGCLAGINEVLYRRGQVPSRKCLNPAERLSPGQAEEIDRVQRAYPQLNDDAFVAENLTAWLA